MNAVELLEAVASRGAVIYGAGFVGDMFFRALEAHGLSDRIVAVVVTEAPASLKRFHGIPVESAAAWALRDEMEPAQKEAPLICLCVHEAAVTDVRRHAGEIGLDDAIWVYPLLHELLFGKPLQHDVSVPIASLLAAQPSDWHWISARAAALAELDGRSNCGRSAYVKCMQLHCGEATARERLALLEELSNGFSQDGYKTSHPILVDEDLQVIDGLHRLALAAVRGLETVPCNIVAKSPLYGELFGPDNVLDTCTLDRTGLTADERALIDELQDELFRPEISIVLPVYNVAGYIDQCMESVVAQTYPDFEAILVNDGSTDDSAAKCAEWVSRDPRIRFIDKPNGGVSSARNRGIEEARGTYLAFVDPDDWLDERYLETLHTRAVQTGADFVECDIWRYSNRSGTKIHRFCGQRMGVPYSLAEHMKYGPTASYKSLSERALWTHNDLAFPSCAFESPAIYALVLALANRIEYIPEPLYYYRRFRENSLIETAYAHKDGSVNNTLGVEAMEYLVEQFKTHGLYDRFADDLPGIVLYRLNDILAMQYHRKTPADFAELVANYRAFVDRSLPQAMNAPYITWGGYNLSKVCQDMPLLHDPSCRFGFSSIISLLGPDRPRCELNHRNRYRQMMLQREMDREFEDVLEREQPAFIVCDLLEERFDILAWNGRYLTLSDAFEGAEGIDADDCRIIDRFSDECTELFERAAALFADTLARLVPDAQIIIVENYLTETVGSLESRHPFENVERIRQVNELLRRYYDIVCGQLSGAVRIRAYEANRYFTDENYEYGALPSHLNALANQEIAQMIEKALA